MKLNFAFLTSHRPRLFVLAVMFLGFFLSMWISNVAAPLLIGTLLTPIVRDFNTDSPYVQTLLLGLAIACNIGGMASPISSPQNAVALGYLENKYPDHAIGFGEWMSVSVPFCFVLIVVSWAYLLYFTLGNSDVEQIPEIVFQKEPITEQHYVVVGVSIVTIGLWCTLGYTKPVFGQMGTVALIPLIVFFSSGVLTKSDLNMFSWNLILLIGSGNTLGAAVSSSSLLNILVRQINPYLLGLSTWVSFIAVVGFTFVITTFVSHTVAALILTPLIVSIGVEIGHVESLTMSCTLMMSGCMSLPMSSFPNINSLLFEDDYGKPYLSAMHFLKHGTPLSLFNLAMIVSLGYALMLLAFK